MVGDRLYRKMCRRRDASASAARAGRRTSRRRRREATDVAEAGKEATTTIDEICKGILLVV